MLKFHGGPLFINGKEFVGQRMSVNEAHPRTDRGRSGDREGERVIVAAGTAIDPIFLQSINRIVGKRLINDIAEKAREASWTKTQPLEPS